MQHQVIRYTSIAANAFFFKDYVGEQLLQVLLMANGDAHLMAWCCIQEPCIKSCKEQ
jgi:hypothetical protein